MASRRHYPDPIRKLFLESLRVRAVIERAERAGRMRGLTLILEKRFGLLTPTTITAELERAEGNDRLDQLTDLAVDCNSPQSYEAAILDESLRPTPSKRQAKRRSR